MNRYFLKYDDNNWTEVEQDKYVTVFEHVLYGDGRSRSIDPTSFFHAEAGKSVAGRVLPSWRQTAYEWDEDFRRVVGRVV